MRVTKRLMAALLACLMLLSLLPVPAYAADDGRIALLAVTQDGYVIEPEYIGYRSGDTVKDVLKNSGHTFSGIDSGFITAVDGRTDNYSLHYDGVQRYQEHQDAMLSRAEKVHIVLLRLHHKR